MGQRNVVFICMAMGDFYGMADQYVARMFHMLQQHAGPFELWCFTDRPRQVPVGVRQVDCSQWTELDRPGMRRTTRKIGLFNPAYTGLDEFFYLDLTLVVRASLTPLLDHALSRPEDLVILKDWHYDSYNSSVMRIRPAGLAFIYQDFLDGVTFAQKTPGDQDFIFQAIQARQRQSSVALFPPELVASFKRAIRTGRKDRAAAARMVEHAVIVKFHGDPRMHKALSPFFSAWKYRLPTLLSGHWSLPFSLDELRRHWTSPGA